MLPIYITIFVFVIIISAAKKNSILNNRYTNNAIVFLLFITITISIYNIDIHSVPDLKNYLRRFENLSYMNFDMLTSSLSIKNEPLFDIFQWLVAKTFGSFKLFVALVWIIIFINFYKTLKNIFDSSMLLFVFVSYLSFFIFFNYVVNVMRQGLAISFILLAISILVINKNKFTFYISILIAPLLHITALPLSIILITLRLFNIKFVIITWALSILVFVTGINARIFSGLEFELMDIYTSSSLYARYSSINRIDFLAFSVFFAILFIFFSRRLKSDAYNILLKIYLIFNIYFLLLGFIAFNDRLAAYSWMLIPILLWYAVPNTTNERYKTILLTTAFLASMMFTGSMSVILESSL